MSVATFTKSGTKAATPAKLDKKVFGVKVESHRLLKDAYLSYLANGRANLARSKKRGEVSGGGQKPWRQKGTGRARFGSSRNPIWKGGGVAFGPTGNENYVKKLNIKSKRQALRQALTLAAGEDRIKVIDDITFSDGKVKSANNLLNKISKQGDFLIVVETKDELLIRALRNLARAKVVQANYLNVYDVMNTDYVLITKKALELIHNRLGGTAVTKQENSDE